MGTPLEVAFEKRDAALRKAWASLARYKFIMFGYHAAQWVTWNKYIACISGNVHLEPNPFRDLVVPARNWLREHGAWPQRKNN